MQHSCISESSSRSFLEFYHAAFKKHKTYMYFLTHLILDFYFAVVEIANWLHPRFNLMLAPACFSLALHFKKYC